jgi:uncharacterized protein
MRSLLIKPEVNKIMKKSIISFAFQALILICIAAVPVSAQDIPNKPDPPRLVNDFAGILRNDELNALENRLVAFNDSTSTQIAVILVPDLQGYDKADFAQRLGEKWGIGQKGSNNGIVVLVKPKTESSNGQAQIAPGYGLEGVLPDIVCKQIVENEMIPYFRNNDYYGGLSQAVGTIMALSRGEFTADQYRRRGVKTGGKDVPVALILFVIFIVIAIIGRNSGGNNNRKNIGSSNLPLWVLLGMMNSGRGSHGGSWGGFSGGGGSGGGGFGGFGGGSFGGGGAGGSW